MAFVIGGLFAAGLYMMMRRSLGKLIIGIVLLSHAVNLLIFVAGGLTRGGAPVIPEGAEGPFGPISDPLPQALILTAIVISFGFLAFTAVLFHRTQSTVGTADLDQLRSTDT
jgi:multicomponent Na+:H+ antiporter subunit C